MEILDIGAILGTRRAFSLIAVDAGRRLFFEPDQLSFDILVKLFTARIR